MSLYRTRVVELAAPAARATAQNRGTIIARRVEPTHVDFRALFVRHYDRIRASCLDFAEPGLAVFAISLADDAWQGTMCLASRAGELRAGVVGRHGAAELYLGDDDGLALRHLVYLVEPPRSLRDALRGEVRFRVLDLETGNPPRDEHGRAVASLTAEGPVFLACHGVALLAFVAGDPTDWPERADDAWACLPERVFVAERLAPTALGSAPAPLPGAGVARHAASDRGRITLVRTHAGPRHVAARHDGGDEIPYGQIVINSGGKVATLRVGREALRRGLLVGRYDRCQASADGAITDERVSRVHLLVVEVAGQPHAIDLASSNGSHRVLEATGELAPIRTSALDSGQLIALADGDTLVGWLRVAACPDPGGS